MREPKLWKRRANGIWYVKLNGRQVPLGRDEAKAKEQYHGLLASRQPVTAETPVKIILGRFLSHVEETGEPRTYEFYRQHLRRFADYCGGMRVSDLRVHVVTRFLSERYKGTSSTYRNGAVRAIKRAFNYAEQEEWIERSPVAKVKAPPAVPRDCCLEPDDLQHVWSALDDSDFSDAIRFLILTGARPYEMRTATADDVNRQRHTITFTRERSKGKRHRRTITLSDKAWALVEHRLAKAGGAYLFTNRAGRPWTGWALNLGCKRLSKRIANKLGRAVAKPGNPARPGEFPHLFPYIFRHTWATDSLCETQDAETVSKLMGHAAGSAMVSRVYSHVAGRNEYLRSVVNRLDEARRLA